MAAWILDDTPLELLAGVIGSKEASTWPVDELFVADATWQAASGSRKDLLTGSPSPFKSFPIMMGTEASDILYNHLKQPARSTANLAEFQAIAWAMTERPDSIFVTIDRRATVTALAELGRCHVAHAFDLWLLLKGDGRIDQAQFRKLCEATRRVDQGLPSVPRRCAPSWPTSGSIRPRP